MSDNLPVRAEGAGFPIEGDFDSQITKAQWLDVFDRMAGGASLTAVTIALGLSFYEVARTRARYPQLDAMLARLREAGAEARVEKLEMLLDPANENMPVGKEGNTWLRQVEAYARQIRWQSERESGAYHLAAAQELKEKREEGHRLLFNTNVPDKEDKPEAPPDAAGTD